MGNADMVDDAIALLERTHLTVRFSSVQRSQVLHVHWTLCDASGACAVDDGVDGEWSFTRISAYDRFICTNDDEDALALQ